MAVVTENDLKLAIRDRKFSRAYFFYGKDAAAAESYTKSIVSRTVKSGDEAYNLHAFDGKNFDMESFSDSCEALPVFAERVCCTVCDLNAEGLPADSLKRLTEIISNLPDTTLLIFYYTSVDVCDGKKYPTAKNKKLMDAVGKVGGVCNFALKTPSVLAKEIMAKVSKEGCGISREAAYFLAEQCSCNTLMIGNETDKLIAYAAGNEITVDTVKALSPGQLDTTSFDLAEAITAMNAASAMKLLGDLKAEKAEPIAILYSVTGSMLDLYRARAALAAGKSAADVKEDFGYAKNLGFRVDKAFKCVQKISMPHIRMCIKTLAETDIAMKSMKTDSMVLLEEAIVKMLKYGR